MNSPFAEAILNGSLLLAIPVALLAGLVSFLSPCVLPLVPGYLGYVTGLTGVDLQKQKRGRMLAGIGLFVLGFSVIFVLLGGAFGQQHRAVLVVEARIREVEGLVERVGGGLLIAEVHAEELHALALELLVQGFEGRAPRPGRGRRRQTRSSAR